MPEKNTRSSVTVAKDLTALRAEIRFLGGALGKVISQLEGKATFDRVENLRTLAKASRQGEAGAADRLAASVAELSGADAVHQAMAFTLYFELVNLAEENFRVMLLRRRRAAAGSGSAPRRESIEAAVRELKSRGVTTAEMQGLVDRLNIELVFTAHPTESKRRTLLTKLRRLAEILRLRHHPEMSADTPDAGRVEREIASLWLTDRSRVERPEVTDEARTGLWYFDTTLFETLPRLQKDMVAALKAHFPEVTAPKRWLNFGSWIGGDRDGNPNVTAGVTAEVLLLHRTLAVEKLRYQARELSRSMSVSDRRDTISPEVRRFVKENKNFSAHLEVLGARYPHEPYRLVLNVLRGRLARSVAELGDARVLASEAVDDAAFLRVEAVREMFEVLRASLKAGKGAILEGELTTVMDQLDVFGLHTARLDMRQHSGHHEAAVAEVLGRPDYAKLDEAGKRAVLAEAIGAARPLALMAIVEFSAATRHVLEPLRLAALAARKFGAEALGIYIISMTTDVSDMLEVQLLMRLAGASLPIAPLFETLEDLNNAPRVLGELMEQAVYGPLLEKHGRHQHIMLGYSDSNKDCGYLAANWALYRAQEKIARVAAERNVRVTLFHGRGGSIARGGGPAAKAILAQPVGLRDGGIRVTEQGEVLSTRYHDPDLAHRILEQMTYGVLLGSHAAQKPAALPEAWMSAMERMSETSVAAYQAAVHNDPQFLEFWRQATPIDQIGNLKFGSRPTYRKATQSVADLRAIPWVFSWMQSRFNFPGWYGLGTALETVLADGPRGKKLLREMHASWPFFQTLIDNAEVTMRKADMGIARLYSSLVENAEVRDRVFALLQAEFNRTEQAILAVTGRKQLLGGEPVLLKSVQLRNPYIDPLNYMQVELLRRLRGGKLDKAEEEANRAAIELTINGISGGLKNTG